MFLFAFKTLLFDRGKLLIALVGVIFSVVLVNVQVGLLLGLVKKASILVDHSGADLWVCRRGVENVDFALLFSESWVDRLEAIPGVAAAEPIIVSQATFHDEKSQGYENVWVIGSQPDGTMGRAWNLAIGSLHDLSQHHAISIDQLDRWKLGDASLGDFVELNDVRVRIAAETNGVQAFTNTPFVFTTLQSAQRICRAEGFCSYVLVRARPGIDLESLQQQIQVFMREADVETTADFSRKSQNYWLARTGIGISFGASTSLGLLVGIVMVGQSLYALTLDHLADYATLKALGASNDQIESVLMLQSMTICAIGTLVGLLVTFAIVFFFSNPVAPILVPRWLLGAGIGLSVGICLVSYLIPLRRVSRVDPATVLQG